MAVRSFLAPGISIGAGALQRLLVVLAVIALAADVRASAGGRSSFSGDPTANGGATCTVE